MTDELTEKLSRIDRRLEAKRREIRSRLQARPELLDLCDAAKETFNARLTYLRLGDFTHGVEPVKGIPVSARVFALREGKGKIARMRQSERNGP